MAEENAMYMVGDVMTREVITLSEDDDLGRVEAFLSLGRIRHLPVTRDGRLVGLVTHRDLLRAAIAGVEHTVYAKDVMTREIRTVSDEMPLTEAARVMLDNKFGCLPVVDANNRLVGLVTESDLVRFALKMVEDLDAGLKGLETVQGSVDDAS